MGKISTENLIIKSFRNSMDEQWDKIDKICDDINERIAAGRNRSCPALFEDVVKDLIKEWYIYSSMQADLDTMLDIHAGIITQDEVLNPEDDEE